MKTDLHHDKGTALITGASRGIGAIYADRLAKRGYDLILVARDETALKALAGRLTSETGRAVTPLPADLNAKADLAKVETTLRKDQTITMLVNNAGIGAITPLLNSEIQKMEEMILSTSRRSRDLPMPPHPHSSRVAQARSSTLHRSWASHPRRSMVSTARRKPLSLRSAIPCNTNSRTKVSGSRRCCRVRPLPNFRELAGSPWQKLPPSIVMPPEEMVDAALVGLDQGELVSIPSLHDGDEWTRFEAARRSLSQQFANSVPAPRYDRSNQVAVAAE